MPPMPVAIRPISMASRKPGCMLCRSRSAARCILTKGKWKKTAISNVARTGFAASPARSSNGAGKLRAGPPPNKKWPPRRAAKVWEETPRDGAAAYSRRNDNAALQKIIEQFAPDAVHIATEGPLGVAARAICLKRRLPFTTSLTTRFPEYLHLRMPLIPAWFAYALLRAFHAPAHATMVSSELFIRELKSKGFEKVRLWSRGVDAQHFRPRPKAGLGLPEWQLRRPVFLYVGRIAVEKNIDAFLSLDLPGTKLVAGDGPQRVQLQRRH